MNYMEQVAHLLGVELEEEFLIKTNDEIESYEKPIRYKFTKEGFVYSSQAFKNWCQSDFIHDLLNGKSTIVKIPFKPKYEEEYWFWYKGINERATSFHWYDNGCDFMAWKLGNCFRTKEEAETKGKELMESIVKEYNE